MAQNTETLLLQVDIQANNTRLVELQKQLNDNKAALTSLNAAFKDNKLSADELATGQVRLAQSSKQAQQEIGVLNKANAQQQAASLAATGSNEQLRAQLALATTAYNKLSVEERDNSEAGQKLQAQTKALSDELKKNESAIGDNRRNVGNYSQALEPVIQQLVKLQEQEKLLTAATGDNSAAIEVNKKGQLGFLQQLSESGAKAGLSADQVNAKLSKTADAIRPATAELVKLEAEQSKVEQGTKAYTQIGFKIGQANKEVSKVTSELKQVEAATDGVKKGFDTVTNKVLGPFQGEIDKATGLIGKFKTGNELVAKGITQLKGAGETGSLGFKALASGIALTGIGLFVIAISAVVTYFTQSAEGGKILAQVMAGLGAAFQIALDLAVGLGKSIVYAVTHPIEATKALSSAITDALLHPIDTAKRLADGVGNVGKRFVQAAKDGADLVATQKALAKERRQLEIDEVKEQSRVNVLLRLSKERGKTATEQLGALQEAGRLEAELTNKNIALQQKELDAIKLAIKLKGSAKAADLIVDKANKEKEIAQSLAAQDEVNAKIRVRESVFLEKQRADAKAAAQKAREDAIKERIAQTETELLGVKAGSERELELRGRLVSQKAELEEAGEKKTAADRKLILAQSLSELLKLDEDFEKGRSDRARAFLDAQLVRDQAAATAKQKQRDEAKKAEEEAYAQNERLLERNLARQAVEIEKNYTDGLLTKEQYENRISLLEENALGARLILQKQFNKDTTALETQLLKSQGARSRKAIEEEKQKYAERLQTAQAFGSDVGALFAQTLTETGATLQEFAGKVLVLILDQLEKQVLAQQAAATAAALAQPDSVATFGATGLVRAGIINGLIVAAFETAKALISQGTQAFNTGGQVAGQGNTDTVPAMLTPGEIVMNKAASQELAPVLSYLNAMYGGKDFAPGFTPNAMPRQIDGGLMARAIGQSFPSAAEIGREVGRNVPKEIGVRTLHKAENDYQRPRARTRLG